jgi:flagellar capping protein FliD
LEIKGLQETNLDLEESVTRIDDQILTYRDQLLEKFSALEAAISTANQLLLLLDAQSNAQNNSS